jgi:DNA mismatch endonuclease (patch repair protein)
VPKLDRNRRRDLANAEKLENAGWRVLTVWECEIDDMDGLTQRLLEFLEERRDEAQP